MSGLPQKDANVASSSVPRGATHSAQGVRSCTYACSSVRRGEGEPISTVWPFTRSIGHEQRESDVTRSSRRSGSLIRTRTAADGAGSPGGLPLRAHLFRHSRCARAGAVDSSPVRWFTPELDPPTSTLAVSGGRAARNSALRMASVRGRVTARASGIAHAQGSGSVGVRLLPPLDVDRLVDLPEHDPDDEHGLAGDDVLLIDGRSSACHSAKSSYSPDFVLKNSTIHLRRSRSRSFSRSSTARRYGFSSLPRVNWAALRESGFSPAFAGSTGSNPVCASSA